MIEVRYNLNMVPDKGSPIHINVSQNDDKCRTFIFKLYSSDGSWTAPASATATIEGRKDDGKFFTFACTYSIGEVTVVVQQQMVAVAGKVRCKIKLVSGAETIESAPFYFVVNPKSMPVNADMSKSDVVDAVAKATQKIVDQVAGSIPQDYVKLNEDVSGLKSDLDKRFEKNINFYNPSTLVHGFYVDDNTGEIKENANWSYFEASLTAGTYIYSILDSNGEIPKRSTNVALFFASYDSGGKYISGSHTNNTGVVEVPSGARKTLISSHFFNFTGSAYISEPMLSTQKYYNDNGSYKPYSAAIIKEEYIPKEIARKTDIDDCFDPIDNCFDTDEDSVNLADLVSYSGWSYITCQNIKSGKYYLCNVPYNGENYRVMTDPYCAYFKDSTFVSGQKLNVNNKEILVPEGCNSAKISSHSTDLGVGGLTIGVMLIPVSYYDENVKTISDYIPYYKGTGEKIAKKKNLPSDIVYQEDLKTPTESSELLNHYQSYFDDEVSKTVEAVLEKTVGDSVVFTIVTDCHMDIKDEESKRITKETFENIKAVNKLIPTNAIIGLGDYTKPNDDTITDSESAHIINTVRGWMLEANDKVLMVSGNHDGSKGSVPKTQNYNCMGYQNDSYVDRISDNSYFFYDDKKHKIRMLFLNTNNYVANRTYWGLDDTQYQWLNNSIKEMPNEYSLMIFSHDSTFDTHDFVSNRDNVISLLNSFHNHKGDFTDKTGKCLIWMCGHQHFDWVVPSSASGLDFPVVVTTKSGLGNWTPTEDYGYVGTVQPTKISKTSTQDAWDVLIYRLDEQKIYFVRFGAGEDREIDLSSWNTSD